MKFGAGITAVLRRRRSKTQTKTIKNPPKPLRVRSQISFDKKRTLKACPFTKFNS
jgi:hypothetical protein